MSKLQRYSSYKESGVEWLGDIPQGWEVKKLKYILKFTTGATPSSHSESYYNGEEPWVTISDMDGRYIQKTHFISKSGIRASSMSITPKNSLLYSFKLSVGQVAFNKSELYTNEAIASFHPAQEVNLNFWYYALPIFVIKNANTNIYGAYLLNQDLIKNADLIYPPKSEQTAIASYLDTKTTQIDQAISQKEQLIELLKERRQIVINEAVTKGLNPNIPMKESGVEWIGEIPEHWEIRRAKYLFKEIDERSKTGKEELLSVSHMTGVTPRSEKNVSMFMSEDYTGSKTCKKDDLVMNIMWAWMGALGVSAHEGIVSSSYAIYRQTNKELNSKYIEYLLKSPKYIEHYNRVSTGLHSSRLRFYSHMFMRMKIGFPSINEQFQIITYIEEQTAKMNTAIELQQNYIAKLKEYKATLIDSVATGKVRVA